MAVIEQLGNLEYKITLNTTELERGQKKASSIMSRLDTNLGRLANLTLASQGITAFSKRIISMGTDVIKAATTMQSLERGLRAVAGGAAAADAQLIGLREVAKLPGLGLQEAVQGAVNLQAAGLSAERATDSLKAFGNALATVGKGKAELDGVILALTQMQAKGKLSAEEINQIAERVPQIRRVMVEAFGTAIPKEIEKMGISVDDFIDRVNKQLMTLPQVVGGAANTFENLGDTIFEAKTRIGELFLPAVLSAAEAFASALGDVNRALTPLSDQVKSDIAAWDSLKTQWQAQDTEITKLVGQYNTLQTRLKAITESGGDTHAVQADLERVNKSLIELVPQLGVAYDKEKQALVGLNETLERHREAKGRMLRMAFRENLEKTTKATKEATAAEKIAIKQRDLQLYIMKRVKEEIYEVGEATGRFGIEIALNTATMKKATTVSQLYRDAREELGLTEEETSKSETKLRAGLKEKLGLEQALALQIGASTDKVNTYRTEIESLQGTVRSYVETTGKNNVEQFNKLVDIYSSLHDEQGKLKEITPEYTTALNKLATQVNLTGTALEQGLGAKITVVEDKLVAVTEKDRFPGIFLDAEIKVPTDAEISKKIRDFTSKVKDAIDLVATEAKDEGKYDPKQVMEDQLDTLKSMLKAEGITEAQLKKEYTAIYTARANLRHNLKTINDGIAKAQADKEIAEKARADQANTASGNAYNAMIKGWHEAEVKGAGEAATALMGIVEGKIDDHKELEEGLNDVILGYQNATTTGQVDALDAQFNALKEQHPETLLEVARFHGLQDDADEARANARIKYNKDADNKILEDTEDFINDRVEDEEDAAVLRKKIIDDLALKEANVMAAYIKAWDEVGSAVVDLAYLIDTDLGQSMETALMVGGAFLDTWHAVNLAMAGAGTWWTVAAKGITFAASIASIVFGESKSAAKRRELFEDLEKIKGEVSDLRSRARVGDSWVDRFFDPKKIKAAEEALATAWDRFHNIRGDLALNQDEWDRLFQTRQNAWKAASRELDKVREEEARKEIISAENEKLLLKQRIAEIEGLTSDLTGTITDSLIEGMDEFGGGWQNVQDAISSNLSRAIFKGIVDAQVSKHQLEPLVERYVAFLTDAISGPSGELNWQENQTLRQMEGDIRLAATRIKNNTEALLNEAWDFNWEDVSPDEEDLADITPSIIPTIDVPETSTGLTTSIRNITRSQADALSAVFSNISAINGRIADNTLRTADLLETYLPSISGGGMMVQSTDVGGASWVDPAYEAMMLQNANRANG